LEAASYGNKTVQLLTLYTDPERNNAERNRRTHTHTHTHTHDASDRQTDIVRR